MKRFVLFILMLTLLCTGSVFAADKKAPYTKEMVPFMQVDPNHYFVALRNGKKVGIIKTTSMIGNTYEKYIDAIEYFNRLGIKYVIIFLNSPGGDLFEGLAAGQYMRDLENRGWTFEVRCHGLAASAASIILAAGTPDKRYMSKYAFLMVHELSVFEFLSYKNVSDKEKEAKVLRGIQNDVNSFVAAYTGKTADFIYHMAKEETWVTAEKAIKFGFCDHVILAN